MVSADDLMRIWRDHSARLLIIARSIGEPAEDALQEAFLKLSQQSDLPLDPVAWMVRVIRNQIISWNRKASRIRSIENFEAVVELQPLGSSASDSGLAWFQSKVGGVYKHEFDAQEIQSLLLRLNPSDREIVVWHVWGELTFEQMASIREESRSTLARRYQSALARLRQLIDDDRSNVTDSSCRTYSAKPSIHEEKNSVH
jgi:RNA polymerase sigma factor (sigma-70 family)